MIDFHAHWVPEALAGALAIRDAPPNISGGQFHMPVGSLPFDSSYSDLPARLRQMDAQGVQTQILSLPCLFGLDSRPAAESIPLLEIFNAATADAVRAHKGRFAGLASLPFDDIGKAAQAYRHARRRLGLLGAIVPINYFMSIAGLEALAPLLDMAEKEGGHLFLHPGRRADEAGSIDAIGTARYPDSTMPRRQLEIQHEVASAMVTLLWGGFTERYQGFSLHVANMGGPLPLVVERMDFTSKLRTHEAILPSKRLRAGGVLVDCSSMGPIAIKAAVESFGAENIMLGTDSPIYRSDWQVEALQKADIGAAARRAVLRENAASILKRWQ